MGHRASLEIELCSSDCPRFADELPLARDSQIPASIQSLHHSPPFHSPTVLIYSHHSPTFSGKEFSLHRDPSGDADMEVVPRELRKLKGPQGVQKATASHQDKKTACQACHERKKRCISVPSHHRCKYCSQENQACLPRERISRYVLRPSDIAPCREAN